MADLRDVSNIIDWRPKREIMMIEREIERFFLYEKKMEEEATLDLCLTLTSETPGPGPGPRWLSVSIPYIIPSLSRLKDHVSSRRGCYGCGIHLKHKHDDHINLDTVFNFEQSRFPFVPAHINGVFTCSRPDFKGTLRSVIIGNTVYCLGGDFHGIDRHVEYLSEPSDPFVDDPSPHHPYFGVTESYFSATDTQPSKSCYVPQYPHIPTTTTTAPNGNPNRVGGICHTLWYFDLSNPYFGWMQGGSLLSPRLLPLLISFQGLLYAFGGNHPSSFPFAEVYNPVSHTWTPLPTPPFYRLAYRDISVIPLKGWNKLWVFSNSLDISFTYHVLTRKWDKFHSSVDILPHLSRSSNFVTALTPLNHVLVYWIDAHEHLYAYDLSTRDLFWGTVSDVHPKEKQFHDGLSLFRLQGDLFCLISFDYPQDAHPYRSVLHVTVLQISLTPRPFPRRCLLPKFRKLPPKPLTASVLACFAYPFKEFLIVTDCHIL